MVEPYYQDANVVLYHGDMREVIPALGLQVDAIITEPPYGETKCKWDRWPDGWPAVAASAVERHQAPDETDEHSRMRYRTTGPTGHPAHHRRNRTMRKASKQRNRRR